LDSEIKSTFDLFEAERLCEMIVEKDREDVQRLLQERDLAKKEWLSSFLNGELH
jgi:hypothetical protein